MAQAWRLITKTVLKKLNGDPKNLSAKNFCFKVDFGGGSNRWMMVGLWWGYGRSLVGYWWGYGGVMASKKK
jgi:hypothetical protein